MPVLASAVRHLAIESTRLLQEQRGIGRYVRNLVREFAAQRPSLRFTLYVNDAGETEAMRAYLEALHPTLNARTWIETTDRLPYTDADVVWYPWNFITVPARDATMVVTVHDIAPMLQLDHRWWKVLKRAKYRARYRRTVERAHAIVTDSLFSRRELVEKVRADPALISVAPLAADDLTIDGADDDAPLRRAGVSGPFFLTVGGQDARKNLRTLYSAMHELWSRGVHFPLVQCGPAPARETRALLGNAPWLRHVGFVTDTQLATLYRRCTALVFPSRYEGFGLPVAEAMRAGAPVICTRESSLPEVAGSAAHYVAWESASGMATAMQAVAEQDTLRAGLREAGRHQAELFAWASTARDTLLVFERAISARGVLSLPIPSPATPLTPAAVIAAAPRLHRAHDG
jgi:glycosyltransferase involved in cell wall biosynthesis